MSFAHMSKIIHMSLMLLAYAGQDVALGRFSTQAVEDKVGKLMP